jgi:hypothetical protein
MPRSDPDTPAFWADYVYMSEEHKRMLFITTTDHFWTKNRLDYDYQDQLPATFTVNGFNLADGELKFPESSFYVCPIFHYYRIYSIALPDSGPLESCISIAIKSSHIKAPPRLMLPYTVATQAGVFSFAMNVSCPIRQAIHPGLSSKLSARLTFYSIIGSAKIPIKCDRNA